jgi:hypothetical protein
MYEMERILLRNEVFQKVFLDRLILGARTKAKLTHSCKPNWMSLFILYQTTAPQRHGHRAGRSPGGVDV